MSVDEVDVAPVDVAAAAGEGAVGAGDGGGGASGAAAVGAAVGAAGVSSRSSGLRRPFAGGFSFLLRLFRLLLKLRGTQLDALDDPEHALIDFEGDALPFRRRQLFSRRRRQDLPVEVVADLRQVDLHAVVGLHEDARIGRPWRGKCQGRPRCGRRSRRRGIRRIGIRGTGHRAWGTRGAPCRRACGGLTGGVGASGRRSRPAAGCRVGALPAASCGAAGAIRPWTHAAHPLHVHGVEQHGGFAEDVGHAVAHLILLGRRHGGSGRRRRRCGRGTGWLGDSGRALTGLEGRSGCHRRLGCRHVDEMFDAVAQLRRDDLHALVEHGGQEIRLSGRDVAHGLDARRVRVERHDAQRQHRQGQERHDEARAKGHDSFNRSLPVRRSVPRPARDRSCRIREATPRGSRRPRTADWRARSRSASQYCAAAGYARAPTR